MALRIETSVEGRDLTTSEPTQDLPFLQSAVEIEDRPSVENGRRE